MSSAAMKRKIIHLLASGLFLPALCHAEPGPRRPGTPPQEPGAERGPGFRAAWKDADKDGDGLISKEEFNSIPRVQNLPDAKRQALFNRLDKDADGKLSRPEIGRMGKPADGERPHFKRLWELDVDKSGGISFEEFKLGEFARKLPAEKQLKVFNRLDTDGDGMITLKDRPQPPHLRPEGKQRPMPEDHPEKPQGINRKLDANGDGALSFEEFRVGPAMKNLTEDQQEDRFELLDRNKDQKLGPEDFPPPPEQ